MNDPKIILTPDTFFPAFNRNNTTIVFTNGCFDLLHKGHLHVFQEAKKAGDILIVGVNDDASVKRLKGDDRPVENLATRMQKIAAVKEVDFVVSFTEDTPLFLIQKIQPDILVKGGDYSETEIVGAEIVKKKGGNVMIIPLLDGFSTTAAIQAKK